MTGLSTDGRRPDAGPAGPGGPAGPPDCGGHARLPGSQRRLPRPADLVVPALDSVVEGSWVALVYATLQVALAHAPAALGPLAFAIAAGLGLAWARGARGRSAGMPAGVALAVGAGVVGWLADPAARAAVAAVVGGGGMDAVETALTTNAAGWLMVLAVVRGASHVARARDEERTGRLLGRILLLGIPWAIGLAFAGADRPAFIAQAALCTLLFAGAGLLAVGLGRLETQGATGGVDWRRNPSWLAVVLMVIALMLAASVPAAFLVGAPPLALLDAVWVSIAALVGLAGAVIGTVGAPLLAGFEALMAALPTPEPTPLPSASAPPPGVGEMAPVTGDPRVGLTITILALVALSILLVAIVARIRARTRLDVAIRAGPAPVEERAFEPPHLRVRLPSVRLPRPTRTPTTAPDAYLALLDDLAGNPSLARDAAETPRAHATRIAGGPATRERGSDRGRAAAPIGVAGRPSAPGVDVDLLGSDWAFGGRGGRAHLAEAAAAERAARARPAVAASRALEPAVRRDLGLLVADWELARYAGRRLSAAEDARGVARWRRLRAALRRGPAATPGSGSVRGLSGRRGAPRGDARGVSQSSRDS